jgi:eukaryotic-like serine/threonine-protein kinase
MICGVRAILLLTAALIAALLPAESAAEAPRVEKADGWPSFRGGPEQRGVARSALSLPLELRWEVSTSSPVKSTAAIGERRAYFGSKDGKIRAVSLADGEVAWTFTAGGAVEAAPLLHGGAVIAGAADGKLYALDAVTGRLRWRHATGDKILGGANVDASGRVIVGSYDGKIYAVDGGTGKELWSYETGNFVHATPAVRAGIALAGGCDGFVHRVKTSDGSKHPPVELETYMAASVALDGRDALVGLYDGRFVCIDLSTSRVRWERSVGQQPIVSSAAVYVDRVIFGSRDRNVYALARETGETVWTHRTGGPVDSSPVVAGAHVLVGSGDGLLYALRLADGKPEWSYDLGDAVTASPAVAGGLVVVGSKGGSVFAFGARRAPTGKKPPAKSPKP